MEYAISYFRMGEGEVVSIYNPAKFLKLGFDTYAHMVHYLAVVR